MLTPRRLECPEVDMLPCALRYAIVYQLSILLGGRVLYTLLKLAVVIVVVVWVVGAMVYASWLQHEAHKMRRTQEAERLQRFRQLSPEVQLTGEEPV